LEASARAVDFSNQYQCLSDDELLRLDADSGSLLPEARTALAVEIKRRNLDSVAVRENFSEEERQSLIASKPHDPDLILAFGTGRRAYGRTNYQIQGIEEQYDSTLFIVLFYIPIIPLGTYRVVRTKDERCFYILNEVPLDWTLVTAVWMKAAWGVFIFFLFWAVLLYVITRATS
jgi:hypothetical protein